MTARYSEGEFAEKVDYEGGLWDALLGYGLSSGDVEEGPLKDALKRLETYLEDPMFVDALDDVERLLDQALEDYVPDDDED